MTINAQHPMSELLFHINNEGMSERQALLCLAIDRRKSRYASEHRLQMLRADWDFYRQKLPFVYQADVSPTYTESRTAEYLSVWVITSESPCATAHE